VVAEEQRSNPEAATKTEKSRAAVTTRLLNFGCGGALPSWATRVMVVAA